MLLSILLLLLLILPLRLTRPRFLPINAAFISRRIPTNVAVKLFTVMADESFKQFVQDQLVALPGLRLKAMFGGYGVYQADRFFGIIMDGRLYLRIDARQAAEYLARGIAPFTYEKGRRIVSLDYFEVPAEVLEAREQLLAAVKCAIELAEHKRKFTASRRSRR